MKFSQFPLYILPFFPVSLCVVLSLSVFFPSHAFSITDPGKVVEEQKIGFFTQLGKKIDLNLPFTDSNGKEAPLREQLDPTKPIILVPVYYECPGLCGFLLNGFIQLVKELQLSLGRDYQVATISFDPTEDAELARKKSENVFGEIKRDDLITKDWHFFVGKEDHLRKLLDEVGFRYEKDGKQYAHSSGIIILTPDGEISQYFTGIEFYPWDVRLALIEASKGKIGSAVDHILLYCFRFDPTKGKYTWAAFNLVRAGVLLSLLVFGFIVFAKSKRLKNT